MIPKMHVARKITIMVILICFIAYCKRAPVPVPQNEDDILVVIVNGFGSGQLQDVVTHVKDTPKVSIVQFSSHDDWQNDVRDYIIKSHYRKLVLIGHSWGCARIIEDCSTIRVDLCILYDPVAFNQGSLTLPRGFVKTLVFARDSGGVPVKANIIGDADRFVFKGGHSDIPHLPETFIYIDAELGRL